MRLSSLAAATALFTSALMGAVHAGAGVWTESESNSATGAKISEITVTSDMTTPPLPLTKLTESVDALVTVSGTVSLTTLAVMSTDIGSDSDLDADPSGTIVPLAAITNASTRYTTLTNNNRYAGVGYIVDVPTNGTATIQVQEFTKAPR